VFTVIVARKRRKISRVSKRHMHFDYKSIGSFFVLMGGLYFFALYLATNSPLILIFNQWAGVIIGNA